MVKRVPSRVASLAGRRASLSDWLRFLSSLSARDGAGARRPAATPRDADAAGLHHDGRTADRAQGVCVPLLVPLSPCPPAAGPGLYATKDTFVTTALQVV